MESAGSFTLAIEKARDKLATYSLAQPEDYILKLVQCAVSLGVDELFVDLRRSDVMLFFEVPSSDDTLAIDRLTEALLSPLEEKNRSRSHLAFALCALAAQQPKELMWGEWGPDASLILSLGHGRSELFRNPPFPRTTSLPGNRRFHLLYFKKQQKPGPGVSLSLTSGESQALRSRCSFSPIAVHLNGKSLAPSLPMADPLSDVVGQLTGPWWGAVRLEQVQPCTLRWPEARTGDSRFRTSSPPPFQDLSPGVPPAYIVEQPETLQLPMLNQHHFSAIYGVPAFLYGQASLYYLQDGILLSPLVAHAAGGGAIAVLDGSGLKTDVTGLQVVREERVENDIEQATLVWDRLVDWYVGSDPPLYQNTIMASGVGAVDALLSRKPLRRTVKPLYEYLVRKKERERSKLKFFQRNLENRRSYLAYKRKESED